MVDQMTAAVASWSTCAFCAGGIGMRRRPAMALSLACHFSNSSAATGRAKLAGGSM